MAFTRKMLKALGIEDEKIDQIMEAHAEVTDSLKAERDGYKKDAENLPNVQKELDDLKKDGGDWQKKYNDEHTAFEKYKNDQTAKETKTAKEKAVRAYYESKGIKDKNLEIAMLGSGTIVDSVELDGDKIKDASAIDALIGGTFAGLVETVENRGYNTPNPPANGGTKSMEELGKMSMEDYIAARTKK